MLPAWVFAGAFWIAAAPAGALAGTVERHPGVRLTLELQDQPLHQALETVAELAGTKIDVTGFVDLDRRVTVRLRHATLQKSLEKILRPRSYVLLWMPENILRVHVFRAGSNDVTVDGDLERRLGEASSIIPPPPEEIEAMWLSPPARSPPEIEMFPPPVSELLYEQRLPESAENVVFSPPPAEIEAMWLSPPARSPYEIEILPPPVSELLGEQRLPESADSVIGPPPSTEIQR